MVDGLIDEVIAELAPKLRELLDEVPLVVEDRPSPAVMEQMEVADPSDLCGLYSGIPLTRRSVEHSGQLPDVITIYRQGIIACTGGGGRPRREMLKRQIRRTILHEIGHHFGLGESDLRRYGY